MRTPIRARTKSSESCRVITPPTRLRRAGDHRCWRCGKVLPADEAADLCGECGLTVSFGGVLPETTAMGKVCRRGYVRMEAT